MIVASHYEETVALLKADPIIQALADGVAHLPADALTTYDFMTAALDQYGMRGGTVPTHIGGPAEAIRELLADQTKEA